MVEDVSRDDYKRVMMDCNSLVNTLLVLQHSDMTDKDINHLNRVLSDTQSSINNLKSKLNGRNK